jgi:hypothetical protein
MQASGGDGNMRDPYAGQTRRLIETVLKGRGTLASTLRQDVVDGRTDDMPEAMRSYVEKVTRYAYRVTDDDVKALLVAGYSEGSDLRGNAQCRVGGRSHAVATRPRRCHGRVS